MEEQGETMRSLGIRKQPGSLMQFAERSEGNGMHFGFGSCASQEFRFLPFTKACVRCLAARARLMQLHCNIVTRPQSEGAA
eukprot:6035544-Amphidinium_carterae.1